MFAFGSWQGTAGSKGLELTVANMGTTGYHCKELPVHRGWNSSFPTWESWVTNASHCRSPKVGTDSSQPGNHRYSNHCKELPVPKDWNSLLPSWEPYIGYHCKALPVPRSWNSWFPTSDQRLPLHSQPGNHRLPLQATAASQRLMVSNLKNIRTTGGIY